MPTLVVTFRDRSKTEYSGPEPEIDRLERSIRDAMAKGVDTVITPDLDQEPKHFLCSDIATIHRE